MNAQIENHSSTILPPYQRQLSRTAKSFVIKISAFRPHKIHVVGFWGFDVAISYRFCTYFLTGRSWIPFTIFTSIRLWFWQKMNIWLLCTKPQTRVFFFSFLCVCVGVWFVCGCGAMCCALCAPKRMAFGAFLCGIFIFRKLV